MKHFLAETLTIIGISLAIPAISQHKDSSEIRNFKSKIAPATIKTIDSLNTVHNSSRLNKKDKNHLKQGTWFLTHETQLVIPKYYEFGEFYNDRKSGYWYHVTEEGYIVSKEHYSDGVKDGDAQYFEKGRLICRGNYRGMYSAAKFDTLYLTNPESSEIEPIIYATENSELKNGKWQYFNHSGKVIKEEIYQEDILIKSINYTSESDTSKQNIKPHPDNNKYWYKGNSNTNRSLIR